MYYTLLCNSSQTVNAMNMNNTLNYMLLLCAWAPFASFAHATFSFETNLISFFQFPETRGWKHHNERVPKPLWYQLRHPQI